MFLILVLACFSSVYCDGKDLLLYTSGNYDIVVKDLQTERTLKVFTVQVKKPAGICIDYENDLLFFTNTTDKRMLYRIHLVNDSGIRYKSGEGKLFIDYTVDHIEQVYHLPDIIYHQPLLTTTIDQKLKKLYLIGAYKFCEIDTEEEDMRSLRCFHTCLSHYWDWCSNPKKFEVHHKRIYAFCETKDGVNVLNTTLKNMHRNQTCYRQRNKTWTLLLELNEQFQNLTYNPFTDQIFYVQNRSTIGMLDGHLSSSSDLTIGRKVLMADSLYTANVSSLVVAGDIVVWSSKNLPSGNSMSNNIYLGRLKNKFLSKKNVVFLESPSSNTECSSMFVVLNSKKETVSDKPSTPAFAPTDLP